MNAAGGFNIISSRNVSNKTRDVIDIPLNLYVTSLTKPESANYILYVYVEQLTN